MTQEPQQPGPRYDLLVLGRIRTLIQAFDVHSRRLNSRYGLTSPQLVCLLDVIENAGTTAREISGRIHLGQSTLVGVLDRLEAKGLIERHRDVGDRRRVLVTATEAGARMAKTTPSPLDERLTNALSLLPEHEQARIAASLLELEKMIEAPGEDQETLEQLTAGYTAEES